MHARAAAAAAAAGRSSGGLACLIKAGSSSWLGNGATHKDFFVPTAQLPSVAEELLAAARADGDADADADASLAGPGAPLDMTRCARAACFAVLCCLALRACSCAGRMCGGHEHPHTTCQPLPLLPCRLASTPVAPPPRETHKHQHHHNNNNDWRQQEQQQHHHQAGEEPELPNAGRRAKEPPTDDTQVRVRALARLQQPCTAAHERTHGSAAGRRRVADA